MLQEDFREKLLMLMIYACFGIAVVFDTLVWLLRLIPDPWRLQLYWMFSLANVVLGLYCLYLYQRKKKPVESIANILLIAGLFFTTVEMPLLGNWARNAIYPYVLIIFFSNLVCGYVKGFINCLVGIVFYSSFVIFQMTFPGFGEITFESEDDWRLVLVKNGVFFYIVSLLSGFAAEMITQQEKKLRAQNEELLKLDQYKTDLTNAFVHEFRTPLTAICINLDLLSDELPKNAEIEQYLKEIAHLSKVLENLIEKIFTISRLDSSDLKLEFDKTSISSLVFGVINSYLTEAQSKNIEIATDIDEGVFAEVCEPFFVVALSNLISNAVKFTGNGGKIKVILKEDMKKLIFCVEDTGEGISKKNLPHIFEKYYTTEGGRIGGFGLYAVKRIVELHNGKVFVSSKRGEGTKIGFFIPLKRG